MNLDIPPPFVSSLERDEGAALPAKQKEGMEQLPPALAGDLLKTIAYQKWLQKGQPRGTEVQDWLEAEAELEKIRDLARQLAETNGLLQKSLLESMRREEALRLAEERYHAIFDNAVEGIFQTTADGHFLAANTALARMLGFDSSQELMSQIADIGQQLHVSPECRAQFQRLLQDQGRVQGFECQVYRRDRSVIWISLAARAVREPSGELRYFEGTVEDITERKQATAALRDSEALYRSLIDNLPVSVLGKDLNGRFLFCNQAFCDSLQKSPEQVVGKTDLDFYPPELAMKYVHDDRRVIASGEVMEGIEEHVGLQGRRSFVHILKGPLFDSRREIIGVQCIYWDVTARKQAEAELARTAVEFSVARTIQQKLFPCGTPTIPGLDIGVGTFGFDIGGASYPAEAIGGDYYDFIPLSDGSLGIAIGDVSGHGVGPALLMAEVRALLRAFAQTHADVSEILRLVNRVLVPDIESDRFITLLLAKLNPRTHTLTYTSAGHQTAYLVNAQGIVKQELPSTDFPLGIQEKASFPASPEIPLDPGDIVLLVTDGIVEARAPDGSAFGTLGPINLLRTHRDKSAHEIVDSLYVAVRAFSRGLPQYDDITATVIKVNAI